MKNIIVQGLKIVVFTKIESDFISLTDIARFKDKTRSDYVIQNWLRNRETIEFLVFGKKINNPDFKSIEFDGFRLKAGLNSFSLHHTVDWDNEGNWLNFPKGRNGGTFAHKDIAFEFASWISAEFKLFLIKEFQRLKEEENLRLKLGWDKKSFNKINYRIHTDKSKNI